MKRPRQLLLPLLLVCFFGALSLLAAPAWRAFAFVQVGELPRGENQVFFRDPSGKIHRGAAEYSAAKKYVPILRVVLVDNRFTGSHAAWLYRANGSREFMYDPIALFLMEPAYSLRGGGELFSHRAGIPIPIVPGFDSKLTAVPGGADFVETHFCESGEIIRQKVWTTDGVGFVVIEELTGHPWRSPIPPWWGIKTVESFKRMAQSKGISPTFYTWPRPE